MILPLVLLASQATLARCTLQSGTYTLQSVNSGKYLHVEGESTENGADVQISDDGTGPGSQWRVEAVGDGVYTLQNVGAAKYLNLKGDGMDKGTKVWVWDNPDSSSTQWRLSTVPNGDGTAYVLESMRSSLFLNVVGSSVESGASVWVWDNPGSTSSQWEFIGSDSCHDAVVGEVCYADVMWAKEHGIDSRAEWYPGLTNSSSFADFQAHLHFCFWDRCPLPCAATSLHNCDLVDRYWDHKHSCSDAAAGTKCYKAIEWAQQHGIHAHPEWYPSLSEHASVRQFQFRMFQGQQTGLEAHGCEEPCCHDTVPGELCHEHAAWAMLYGINDPQFSHVYPPSLTNASAFEEFQAYLHLCYPDRCPEPCADTVVQANHQGGPPALDCPDVPPHGGL